MDGRRASYSIARDDLTSPHTESPRPCLLGRGLSSCVMLGREFIDAGSEQLERPLNRGEVRVDGHETYVGTALDRHDAGRRGVPGNLSTRLIKLPPHLVLERHA